LDNFGEVLVDRVLQLEDVTLSSMRNKGYQITNVLLAEFRLLIGCDEIDISSIMKAQDVYYLPPPYREFLLKMGNGTGWVLFRGGDYKCEALKKLKKQFRGTFASTQQFPEDAFVFLGYQGTVFYYFLTSDQSPDPSVYQYQEGNEQSTKQSEHFSQWILEEIGRLMTDDE